MVSDKIFCGLDIGAQKIKVSIIKAVDPQSIELLGVYENNVFGFHDNAVSDLNELGECIHHAINDLIKKIGVRVKAVQLGVNGGLISSRETSTAIPLVDHGTKIIAQRDINRLNNQARLLGLRMEEEVLHDLPQVYQVDDVNSANNPLGLYGRKLGVKSFMITANENRMRNIINAVNQAGFEVENVFFNSYAAAEVVLNERQKKDGSLLIDIGARTTSLLMFKEDILKFVKTIDLGGNRFSRHIAEQLNLPLNMAEEIKKSYAAVIHAHEQEGEEEILVKRESNYFPIKRQLICQSIEEEIGELIEGIDQTVNASGMYDQITQGIVLTGGGALLPGLIERIGERCHMPVELGKVHMKIQKQLSNAAIFSSAIGLAQSGFKKSIGYKLSANEHSQWWQSLMHKVKELYQEYF